MSNVSKGTYYKLRTKKWLLEKGYEAEYIERMQRIFAHGEIIYVKRDLFASDILAMNGKEMIFIQVKFNTAKGKINEALRQFGEHKFPPGTKRWIVVWMKGDHEPEIVEFQEELSPKNSQKNKQDMVK